MLQTTTIDPAAYRSIPSNSAARRPARLARRVPCRVNVLDGDEGAETVLAGHTVQVWRGGVAVQLARGIEPQTRVELQVVSEGDEIDTYSATVAYTRRVMSGTYEVGLTLKGPGDGAARPARPSTAGVFGNLGMIHHTTR